MGRFTIFTSRGKRHLQVATEPPPHSNAYPLNVMFCGKSFQTGSSISGRGLDHINFILTCGGNRTWCPICKAKFDKDAKEETEP